MGRRGEEFSRTNRGALAGTRAQADGRGGHQEAPDSDLRRPETQRTYPGKRAGEAARAGKAAGKTGAPPEAGGQPAATRETAPARTSGRKAARGAALGPTGTGG